MVPYWISNIQLDVCGEVGHWYEGAIQLKVVDHQVLTVFIRIVSHE